MASLARRAPSGGQVVAVQTESISSNPGREEPIPASVLAYLKAPASVNENPKPTSPIQTAALRAISIFESRIFRLAAAAPIPSRWPKADMPLLSWLIPSTSPVLCINYGPPIGAADSIELLVGRPNLALDADPALSSAPSRRRNATILSLPRSRRQGRAGQ